MALGLPLDLAPGGGPSSPGDGAARVYQATRADRALLSVPVLLGPPRRPPQLVVHLVQQLLGLLRMALHVPLVRPLRLGDLVERPARGLLRRGDVGVPTWVHIPHRRRLCSEQPTGHPQQQHANTCEDALPHLFLLALRERLLGGYLCTSLAPGQYS